MDLDLHIMQALSITMMDPTMTNMQLMAKNKPGFNARNIMKLNIYRNNKLFL